MIDASVANTPGWWLARLGRQLDELAPRFEMLDAYARNENGIPVTATKAVRDAYRRLMRMARTNFAELVGEAVQERMIPVGFRTAADGDERGDREAWRVWQLNALEADSSLVHRAMLNLSDAYVIVGGVDDELGVPVITPEDPRQVIGEPDPRFRRRMLAAAKFFHDDAEGLDRAFLYLPGGWVVKAHRRHQDGSPGLVRVTTGGYLSEWMWSAEAERIPSGRMPVVRFPNRPDMLGRTLGEYESHLGVLDRINYTVLSRLEIATLQAFRQRAVKGVPNKDEQGVEIDYSDVFAHDPGALWLLPATAELWESGGVDLGPIRQAIRDDVQDLAAVTRTPLFYLTVDAANGSAEGASLAREGLIFKTKDRIAQTTFAWAQVMSLAFANAGDTVRADWRQLEVLWAPPERYSLAERYDAASKAAGAGVPWSSVMTDVLQFTPTQVARMETERASDALTAALAAPVRSEQPVT